jgi:HemY protein
MIRVIFYFVAVAIVASFAVWIANHPGIIVIEWPWISNAAIEIDLGLFAVALAAFAILAIVLWSVATRIYYVRSFLSAIVGRRRAARGYSAISRGLIAIGAGDPYAARRFAREASRTAPDEPLSLLLSAQSAQLAGNRAAAEQMFRVMASRDDTKLIGLHGLFVEAQRREDSEAARTYAEEAAKAAPSLAWAGEAVLGFRCMRADWVGALEALDRNRKNDMVNRPTYRRHRAVLLTARALTLVDTERDAARTMVLEAVKLAPDLVPAVALAGRLLGEAGEQRRAARLIEAAWRANPHPDLAQAYAHLRPGDSARDRLTRVEILAHQAVHHIESALAVAQAAIDAREFTIARTALTPHLHYPTQRVAMLMAEIEELEHGDVGRAREWMARALHAERDPAWTADGIVSEQWMPVSPVTGHLDAFQWRIPVAHVGVGAPVIDDHLGVAAAAARAGAEIVPSAARTDIREESSPEPADQQLDQRPLDQRSSDQRPRGARDGDELFEERETHAALSGAPTPSSVGKSRKADAVIPLMHIPDDPGPDADVDAEDEVVREQPGEGWRRLRGLFW